METIANLGIKTDSKRKTSNRILLITILNKIKIERFFVKKSNFDVIFLTLYLKLTQHLNRIQKNNCCKTCNKE
ncbi:hypothetical protein JCM15579A_04450 [Marinifilum fragile]